MSSNPNPPPEPTKPEEVESWIDALRRQDRPAPDILVDIEKLAARGQKSDPLFIKLRQQYALVLSKFSSLPAEIRHARALKVLADDLDLDTTKNPETLGIAGGICKRAWLDLGQRIDVDRAAAYYNRAHVNRLLGDDFYNSINAAYLEEVIAAQERDAGFDAVALLARYDRARKINVSIIAAEKEGSFKLDSWWHYATVADAYLGVGKFAVAAEFIRRGRLLPQQPSESHLWTTLRQSARLIRLVSRRTNALKWLSRAEAALAKAFEVDPITVRAAAAGKIGLALSGGGFRASLFHIGILARLAETDLLRHVEVLSCVSGGSIIGAQYYLELRNLLRGNGKPSRADYIALVSKLEKEFLAGVQCNIRTRAAANLGRNLKVLFHPTYSRTERVAELYDEHLFARAPGNGPPVMSGLNIVPQGHDGPFSPKEHNWRRSAKVPMLILNATTLNTGHQWQFTSAEMGEPPYTAEQLDAVPILARRPYAPAEKIALSRAVAASSGVPGLFSPITLDLAGGQQVRLVDGGVHDNQGVASLLEQECKTIIVSDASGQLRMQEAAQHGTVGPVLRSNDILQARLRDAQLHDLMARRRAGALHGLTFVHMTKGLDNDPARRTTTTDYDVRQDVQKALAELRTDLDTFTNAEAYSLMMSGYRMMTKALEEPFTSHTLRSLMDTGPAHGWTFKAVGAALDGTQSARTADLLALLQRNDAGGRKLRLLFRLIMAIVVVLLLTIVSLVPFSLGVIAIIAVVVRYRTPKHPKPIDEVVIGILLATVGWIASNVYLTWFESDVLKNGEKV